MKGVKVLYEDNHLIAVNKPAGVLVHADETGDVSLDTMVKKYLKKKFDKKGDVFLGVIHRLDRPVSGVILFARTSKALSRMTQQFANREVEKRYWAVTYQRPDPNEDTLIHYLTKNKAKNRVNITEKSKNKGAKRCELDYALLSEVGDHYLIDVNLKTGRSHQIRAQLSRIGCPIRGDKKYGSTYNQRDGMIHLHSRFMSFIHPVKKEQITISGFPPKEQIWDMFKHFLVE